MQRIRFDKIGVLANGSCQYGASHEIMNEVIITLPAGYFREHLGSLWPPFIEVRDFSVHPPGDLTHVSEIVPRLPIDPGQCQALKPNKDWSPFRFGPEAGLRYRQVRCESEPSWVAFKDGGGMSMCGDCKKVCESTVTGVSFQRLDREAL